MSILVTRKVYRYF